MGCILHVCGGDPLCVDLVHLCLKYSPRMWRWSYLEFLLLNFLTVFSTYVEVILCLPRTIKSSVSILHVCGGDPPFLTPLTFNGLYSPRMWRWSSSPLTKPIGWAVFSTYVEVILGIFCQIVLHTCILHVCGGDPTSDNVIRSIDWYSPRMWRWSQWHVMALKQVLVFSTYVEVILLLYVESWNFQSILHVCGGDPLRGWR